MPGQPYEQQPNVVYIQQPKKSSGVWIAVIVALVLIIAALIVFMFVGKDSTPQPQPVDVAQTEAPVATTTVADQSPAPTAPVVEEPVERSLSLRPVNTGELKEITLRPQAGNSYGVSNLYDGKNSTAWVIGADAYYTNTPGMDPIIKYATNGSMPTKLMIKNGYNKSSKSYYDNSRVGHIIVCAVGGPGGTKVLYDGWLRDTPNLQTIDLPEQPSPYSTLEISISTDEIYQGSKYWDLCLNEISFRGK